MNESNKKKKFEALLEKAMNDKNVVGLIVTGARSKGVFTNNSDYDVIVIIRDNAKTKAKKEYRSEKGVLDLSIQSLADFKTYASMGSQEEWDRYTFAHAKAEIDKTGAVQKIINQKGILPKKHILPTAKNALGAYLNLLHRSLKNHRDGNVFASHFDASESLSWLVIFLFAIEGRIRPYNKLLRWELEHYPLKKFPLNSDTLVNDIDSILQTGNIATQKKMYAMVKKLALKNGCSDAIRDWDGYYFG